MIKKRFRAHDNLIVDVIKRQSGSLGKAVLEGVMNSVDADGKKIEITLEAGRLVIIDDGRGFRSEQEVDDWFAVFGAPHDKDDTGEVVGPKYGEFRMGRGQLFAFGTNTWSTNSLQLKVDINTMGLDFNLMPLIQSVPGCRVEVDLYDRLTSSELAQVAAEVAKNCKYIDVPVYLNGKQINTPPLDCAWTEITDDAFIKVKEGLTGVEFYQQGVFVENMPSYQIGACGVIVTKKRVKLNFARNQVMRSDVRFKRIMTKFSLDNETRLNTKKTLNEDEIISLLTKISTGESCWANNKTARCLPDTTGRKWSITTLARVRNSGTYAQQPNGRIGYSFACKGSLVADKVMQGHSGLVFDQRILDWLGCSESSFITTLSHQLGADFQYMTLGQLSKGASEALVLIPQSKQTPTETRVLAALQDAGHGIEYTRKLLMGEGQPSYWRDCRVLRVGIADTANGWTDGSTYVAFNRAYLADCGTSLSGWVNLICLLVHELCHTEDDTSTHEHNEQFYRLFHDTMGYHSGLKYGELVTQAYRVYAKKTEDAAGKLHQRQQKAIVKETNVINDEKFLAQHESAV
jgi:hypothetical protein